MWLLGVKVGHRLEHWHEIFANVFDRVFGEKHLSWRCFVRSGIASVGFALLLLLLSRGNAQWLSARWYMPNHSMFLPYFLLYMLFGNILPDYCSLLETRFILKIMKRSSRGLQPLLLVLDVMLTSAFALVGVCIGAFLQWTVSEVLHPVVSPTYGWQAYFVNTILHVPESVIPSLQPHHDFGVARLWFYPAFFTSIWLWLFAESGFILKAARSFDIGFDWFNRHFDIETKPLSSIGLVSGALLALIYWVAVAWLYLMRKG